MRFILLSFIFVFSVTASGQVVNSAEKPPAKATKSKNVSATDQRGTKAAPLVIEVLPPSNANEVAEKQEKHEREKTTNERLIAYGTVALAFFTFFLMLYTAKLWGANNTLVRNADRVAERQANEMERSLAIAKEAADAAKASADAATKNVAAAVAASMPFLHPEAEGLHLHPPADAIQEGTTYSPYLDINFENFGKTPAILRRMGCRLILTENDQLPEVPPSVVELPNYESATVIKPGGSGGGRRWTFERRITPGEMRFLANRTVIDWMRFYVVGYVIYDDFFGERHTRRFCLKVRQSGFQAIKGGSRYNSMEREKAPAQDPGGSHSDEEG